MKNPNETWTFPIVIIKHSDSGKAVLFELPITGHEIWLPKSQIHIKKHKNENGYEQVIVPRWLIERQKELQDEFDNM